MTNTDARKLLRKVHIESPHRGIDVHYWFHCWAHNAENELCALVEIDDGSMKMYPILEYHIVFEDENGIPS